MWVLVTLIVSLQFDTTKVGPQLDVFARLKDEATCYMLMDDIFVKEQSFVYKINSATGQKYVSKIEENPLTERMAFCERIQNNPK
jgi:hypothetical protein